MKTRWAHKQNGFTIVELLIVIVVIGVLAAITIVAYNGINNRALVNAQVSDLKSLQKALELYKVDNGNYPMTTGWVGWDQASNFIPGLSPQYIERQPQKNASIVSGSDTYLYRSTSSVSGAEYKLISHVDSVNSPAAVCLAAVASHPSTADSIRNCWAFGVWSPGGSGY